MRTALFICSMFAPPAFGQSTSELECLYRHGGVSGLPHGYFDGVPTYPDDVPLSGVRSEIAGTLWQGKHFECGRMTNQWAGFRAVSAKVYVGESWLDGRPAVILDYRGSSPLIWRRGRDEIREVSPGCWVGIMFVDRGSSPKLRTFFTLRQSGFRE